MPLSIQEAIGKFLLVNPRLVWSSRAPEESSQGGVAIVVWPSIPVSKFCTPHWMGAAWGGLSGSLAPQGSAWRASRAGLALDGPVCLGMEMPVCCPTPCPGRRGAAPHCPRTGASPLCELHRVYSPISLFHCRAINLPGTAEPGQRGRGKRGKGMAVIPGLWAGRAPQVPPWWGGAQPLP